jgi:hypothetical protein
MTVVSVVLSIAQALESQCGSYAMRHTAVAPGVCLQQLRRILR